jgi:general secretion pathway protein L
MNYKDILNADLQTVARWMRGGVDWWIEELEQAMPASWRTRLSARREVIAEIGEADVVFRGKAGAPIDSQALSRNERDHVQLVVPMKQVLTRVLDFPLLPMTDVRRMVALDIDRLTPFHADAVVFDTEFLRRDSERGRQQVLLGVMPKAAAGETLARARKLDLMPASLGAFAGVGSNTHFDFLPALEGGIGRLGARARLPYWWAAVVALLFLNFWLIAYRDSAELDSLKQIVDSQAAPVEVALRLRDKVDAETERRADLIKRRAANSSLAVLDAVTKALPANAWTQTFEWNGQTVHLAGYSNGPADMLKALESSPSLHNARTMSQSALPAKASGMQSFDVSVDSGKGAVK